MENREFEKQELLTMLNDINTELAKIENGLQSSVNEFWDQWFTQQMSRLSDCGEKLEALEAKLDQIDLLVDEECHSTHKGKRSNILKLEPNF